MMLSTGELAKQAGVEKSTLRFYERRGLLPDPRHGSVGYRRFPPETIRRIRFIQGAQELGFTLREIEELLRLNDTDGLTCREVVSVAEQKREQIADKIKRLKAMQKTLEKLILECPKDGPANACPIVDCFEECT